VEDILESYISIVFTDDKDYFVIHNVVYIIKKNKFKKFLVIKDYNNKRFLEINLRSE
jgi:hypothetical protein